jgi:transcriptional regulator with XRE-family HTH domain
MSELERWAHQEHGRKAQLAREIGVSRQLVSDWIALRRDPSLNQYLKLQAFLKQQKP